MRLEKTLEPAAFDALRARLLSTAEGRTAFETLLTGGERRLSTIRSFTMKGNIVHGTGPTKEFGSFDIACELPDRFVRNERHAWPEIGNGASASPGSSQSARAYGAGSATVRIGFDGPRVLYEPNVIRLRDLVQATPEDIRLLMDEARRRFAELTVGLFAASTPSALLTFADVINEPWSIAVTGSGQTRILAIDPVTHLPREFGDIHYSDYRNINGWQVPHAFRSRVETWELKHLEVNVAIPAKTFR